MNTTYTLNKRNTFKHLIDDFASFSWRGEDMFKKFGMFIINDKKGSLKFYNGPAFSNTYASPKFNKASSILTGMNFKTQEIQFTVGIYWFNIDTYREILAFFNPYEINDLTFTFAPQWRYLVKLKSVKDSPRYIVGKEGEDFYYYTEWQLQFEVQGDACALAVTPYSFETISTTSDKEIKLHIVNNTDTTFTDLDTPLIMTLPIQIEPNKLLEYYTVEVFAEQKSLKDSSIKQNISLFNCVLSNLFISDNTDSILQLKYLSESGLVLWHLGNVDDKLLTLTSSVRTGKRLVQSLEVNKFFLPGKLDHPRAEEYDIIFTIKVSDGLSIKNTDQTTEISIESYARTNVI